MEANYFFIDGSALTAQVRQLQRARPEFRGHRLCPQKLILHFQNYLQDLHEGYFKRATFYFPEGDAAGVEEYLISPDYSKPGHVRDINFKFCGRKLKKSAEFDKFVEENVPTKFQNRFSKSEKGIDIEICCDALRLASSSRLERLFLLTNDSDFIPLCRTIKEFGANISIIHLSSEIIPNSELLRHADSYDVVVDDQLLGMFEALPTVVEEDPAAELAIESLDVGSEPKSEKPDAEPSDMEVSGAGGD